MIQIEEQAKEVLKKVEQHHFEAYFVGGCVRDTLLNKQLKDIDIATSARPEQVMKIFDHVIPVGIEHGTVIVRHKGVSYEVTTFRSETSYSDQRHPDEVVFITSIEEDLARRDFTMNAMAMNRHGQLVDPFSGQHDLQTQIIRTVGRPEERFQEDSLRIIRALRFSSQLGFSIDKATQKQMYELKQQLEQVSVERITEEMSKFFQGEYITKGLQYLQQTKIVEHLPIFKNDSNLSNHLTHITTPFLSFAEVIAFLHLKKEQHTIDTWIKAWKCSNKQKAVANQLVMAIKHIEQHQLDNWVVYRLETQNIEMFVHLIRHVMPEESLTTQQMLDWKESLPIQSRKDVCINGLFIANLFPGYQKGAWIGRLLNEIEYQIVMGEMHNTKIEVKEWIQCHPPVEN